MNIAPGHYWAKWRSAADGTRDAAELTPSDHWEVVRGCAGLGRSGEALFALVPGVDKALAPECFEWGSRIADYPDAERARLSAERVRAISRSLLAESRAAKRRGRQ